VEVHRHVDVDLRAQRVDPLLVDLDHLEAADLPPMLGEDLVHRHPP
jgi:hypothetical protein